MGDDGFAAAKNFVDSGFSLAGPTFDPKSTFNFDTTALYGVKDFRFERGKCFCTFPVTERVSNGRGTLHGGCTGTIVDCITTCALLTMTKLSGVSVHISVSFLAPASIGDEVECEARVVKIGKTLANLDMDLRRKSDNKLVAQGTHIKYMPNTGVNPEYPLSKL